MKLVRENLQETLVNPNLCVCYRRVCYLALKVVS